MPVVLEVSNEYGYVLLTAAATVFVNIWHGTQTVKMRKLSGIDYPTTYASQELAEKDRSAYLLNCAQRAHANFTENLTPVMMAMFASGLRYPVAAASLGACWLVSRVVYAAGYANKGPNGRLTGVVGHYLCTLGLALLAFYGSYQMITGN